MRKNDYLIVFGLCLLAAFIWLRDTAWMTTADDTLPILIALPLFVWLGRPWKWRPDVGVYSQSLLATGICLFVLGIALNLTFSLALGWVLLIKTWLDARLEPEILRNRTKLLLIAAMAFPFVALDMGWIGWWFRLSGAWVAEHVFLPLGFTVQREGTLLTVNGLPISIEVACAGLNTLQSMLLVGMAAAYMLLGQTQRYWISLPILLAMAWIANTIRIIVICFLALLISPEFVMGPFHMWGGLGVLMLMFGLSWLCLSWLEPKPARTL